MKKFVTFFIICCALLLGISPVKARRGNPVFHNNPKYQFYLIDSDDDEARKPTYNFVDTLYNAVNWHRVTGFSSTDDGSAQTIATDSIVFAHSDALLRLPPRYISTNGVLKLTIDTFYNSPVTSAANGTIPTGVLSFFQAIVCPLWADMEFRTTGDSSKVFYRMTTDSCYITYYNLFLKGTNGTVRATFQVAFSKTDSSITFNYKSFDGSFNGTPAATVFQNEATIGVQAAGGYWGTMYLDRGTYYAKTYSLDQYAQPLHNSLAVKFIRVVPNFIRTFSIDNPPKDRFEMTSNTFRPTATVENWTTQDHFIVINYKVTNLTSGTTFYSRTDSISVGFNDKMQDTNASIYQGFPCGAYRLTVTSSSPSIGDGWSSDNIMTRDFTYMGAPSVPFYDNYITLDPCYWHVDGATWVDATSMMVDPPAPRSTGAVLFNRKDVLGQPYLPVTGSDTITSAPINLSGKSGVWLSFSYQRGLSTDTTKGGIKSRALVGPDPVDIDETTQSVLQGDSLIIEALQSAGAKLNPLDSNWKKIAVIYGGIDYTTRKFRMQIDSKYLHDHFRLRIRLAAKDDHLKYGFPIDDDDNWILDAFQLSAPTTGQTDLEPLGVNLGAGDFTHIPRNVKLVTPKVTIGNNGLVTNSAVFTVHLTMKDVTGRFIYDKTQSLVAPSAHSESVVYMPAWDIQGSQGGQFICKVNLASNFNEYYRTNDTNTFYRTLFIDDKYALDDGVPDTIGTMKVAENNWFYYDFIPLSSDSLRGIDVYHVSPSGNTNWTINIMDTTNHVLTQGTRAFSYNATSPATPGWMRGTFIPFYMTAGTKYRMQCIMTQGYDLGGDASKSLMWETTKSSTNPQYAALYPNIVSSFRNSNNVDYVSAKKNADAGGPLLPMVRLVFQGSSTFLPVELASFTAKRTDIGSVNLEFRTAKEESVDHFEIERESSSGWINAGSIAARNERLGANYASLDEKAPSSRLTYNLFEVDLDGSRKLIGTTAVGAFGSSAETFNVRVYPNPATQNIHVMLTGGTDDAGLYLYDALGNLITSREHVSSNSVDIDASMLSAGSYWLEARNGDKITRTKVALTK